MPNGGYVEMLTYSPKVLDDLHLVRARDEGLCRPVEVVSVEAAK